MSLPSGASPQGGGRMRFANVSEAAQAQSINDVMEMISRGYCIDEKDSDGNTALHWAAWFRLDSLVPRLLEKRARADMCNNSGETPVHWAAKSSNISALDALTKGERSLLSMRDCDGFTPFIISAQNDNAPVMEWMYLKGVSVEEQDNWGRTALQWSCYKGHRRAVQWLLSRSASIVHRDHEGTTAIHWAALKGHTQVADMLLEVGAVHLIDAPDSAGDTPMILAVRKKNRYLVVCFLKCQILQWLIGKPQISHNHFANLFVCFIAFNVAIFAFIMAPGIANYHPDVVVWWSLLCGLSLVLWVQNCFADPGWIRPRTIFPQYHLVGSDPMAGFDAEQPVESQMAHHDALVKDLHSIPSGDASLVKMEMEQNKLNYQRQLITQAKKRLAESAPVRSGGSGSGYGMAAGTGETELQPLMDSRTGAQLERAAVVLREREGAAGEEVGRARVERLLAEGGGEYLTLLDKGDFKQICVVCRARRRMRSHHCKDCGRCVDRLDHHCPWIDNCVGLGNQRSFFCFIATLLSVITTFYYASLLYLIDVVWPLMSQGSFFGLMHAIATGALGPEFRTMLVLAASIFNLVWLAFVGALVARHTAYMSMNVTTFEVLVRPSHVQRRFPKSKGRFWFMQGWGLVDCIGRCISYWTLDTERDATDFISGAPPMGDSFVVPSGPDVGSLAPGTSNHPGLTRGGDGRGNSPAYHLVTNVPDGPV